MVDAERLGRIIDRVRADIGRIRFLGTHHDLGVDETALAAVKYTFVTAIEGCTRAAAHIVASERLGVADSNADAVRMLGVHAVVPASVAEPVARAVGFRNVLVHAYADVDDDVVRSHVDDLTDLDAFVEAVAAWVARAEGLSG